MNNLKQINGIVIKIEAAFLGEPDFVVLAIVVIIGELLFDVVAVTLVVPAVLRVAAWVVDAVIAVVVWTVVSVVLCVYTLLNIHIA